MLETTKYQISELPAAQEVGLEIDTNNWCSIRTTHQTTQKHRITKFKSMLEITKYQIGWLPAAKEVRLKLYTNNWCSIRTNDQTKHKLRIF